MQDAKERGLAVSQSLAITRADDLRTEKRHTPIQTPSLRLVPTVYPCAVRGLPAQPDVHQLLIPAVCTGRRVQPRATTAHVHGTGVWAPVFRYAPDLSLHQTLNFPVSRVWKGAKELPLQPKRYTHTHPGALPPCVGIKVLLSPRTPCSFKAPSYYTPLSAGACTPRPTTSTASTHGWRPRTAPSCYKSFSSPSCSLSLDTCRDS